jgi:hypothetical protein
MAAGHILNDQCEALRREIVKELPYGQDWLVTPHQLLGGDTPEERILAGDVEGVRNLLQSILYIGVVEHRSVWRFVPGSGAWDMVPGC